MPLKLNGHKMFRIIIEIISGFVLLKTLERFYELVYAKERNIMFTWSWIGSMFMFSIGGGWGVNDILNNISN